MRRLNPRPRIPPRTRRGGPLPRSGPGTEEGRTRRVRPPIPLGSMGSRPGRSDRAGTRGPPAECLARRAMNAPRRDSPGLLVNGKGERPGPRTLAIPRLRCPLRNRAASRVDSIPWSRPTATPKRPSSRSSSISPRSSLRPRRRPRCGPSARTGSRPARSGSTSRCGEPGIAS